MGLIVPAVTALLGGAGAAASTLGATASAASTLGTIGAGVSALGTLGAGIAQGDAASYAAQVAQQNAAIEQQNASRAIAAGQQAAQSESMKGAAQLGEIKAAQAASGIDVNTGSAVDVQAGQREVNELDTENVLNNAQLQAYGYRVQATSDLDQAALDKAQAEEAPIGAALSAVGGFLGNSSGISNKWLGTPATTPAVGYEAGPGIGMA